MHSGLYKQNGADECTHASRCQWFILNDTNVSMPTQAGEEKNAKQGFKKKQKMFIVLVALIQICTHRFNVLLLDVSANSPPTELSQLEARVRLEMCWLFISTHTHTWTHIWTHTLIHISFLNICPHILKNMAFHRLSRFVLLFFICEDIHTHTLTHIQCTLTPPHILEDIYEVLNH